MNGRIDKLVRLSRETGPRVGLVSLYDVENNAVRLLAAVLRKGGFHVTEIYFKDWISNYLSPPADRELDALARVLRREDVQIACLSVRASAYENVARILTRFIQKELALPVLWGGMHPTIQPGSSIREADLLLLGEGEHALLELAERLRDGASILDTRNIWIRTGDGTSDEDVVRNPLRPLLDDLDSLPFRDYTTHDHKFFVSGSRYVVGDPMRGDPVFQILGSRGCIYRCAYCYNSTFKKQIYPGERWYRVRSPGSILSEIAEAKKRQRFHRVRFDDEVFTFRKDWFDEFCERYPREIGIPFEIFIEPKLVTEERIRRLKEAGLVSVYMGIQSSDRVTDQLYDRRVKNQTVRDIAQLFHKLGIHPHYQLIFDDPVANEADKRSLFDLVSSFPRPFDLYLFSLTVFPGSELNQKLRESGLLSDYEVEGVNTRTFYQHRVNLKFPRPVGDTFWISLIQLLSKDFIPVSLIRPLAGLHLLHDHPWPLIQVAHAANYAKLGTQAFGMVLDREMTPTLLRRWLSLNRIITT
jgi:anaerobic magnesium-protoporphyrin IX monomethyl ester cyclase